MHEDLVTVGTKELARNFDHRIVGIGFVAVGVLLQMSSGNPPPLSLYDHGRG
jgi:hypothetical protein